MPANPARGQPSRQFVALSIKFLFVRSEVAVHNPNKQHRAVYVDMPLEDTKSIGPGRIQKRRLSPELVNHILGQPRFVALILDPPQPVANPAPAAVKISYGLENQRSDPAIKEDALYSIAADS